MLIFMLWTFLQPAFGAEFHLIKRENFIQQVKQGGLKTFCSEAGMPSCYKIDQATCQNTYTDSFASCLKKTTIPKQVSVLGVDQKIENQLGECIGLEYARRHYAKFKTGSACAVRK